MSAHKLNSPDSVALLAALAQARDLCRRLDLPNEAGTFEGFITRFQKELPTYEVLQDEVGDSINGIPALRILTKLGDDHSEFNRLQDAFGRVLFSENYEEQERRTRPLEERIDDHCDKVIASSAKSEARQWLRQRSRGFFKTDRRDVGRFVKEFYDAGAKEVLIGDIEEDQSAQLGQSLLIVLPKEANARAKLFEIGSRAEDAFQCDPVSDKGQKYLYYSLD
jgi:hypothetical protein